MTYDSLRIQADDLKAQVIGLRKKLHEVTEKWFDTEIAANEAQMLEACKTIARVVENLNPSQLAAPPANSLSGTETGLRACEAQQPQTVEG